MEQRPPEQVNAVGIDAMNEEARKAAEEQSRRQWDEWKANRERAD